MHERHNEHREAVRCDRERRGRADDHPDFNNTFGRRYDDDRDRWGRELRGHGNTRESHGARRDAPRRERSRSPWRRDSGYGNRSGRRMPISPTPAEIEERSKADHKLMFKPNVATMADAANRVFNLHSSEPSSNAIPRSPLQMFQNISRLAEVQGNDSWSDTVNNKATKVQRARMHNSIPVKHAYYRIKRALPPENSPTIQEVDDALSKLAEAAIQPPSDDGQIQAADPAPATPTHTTSAAVPAFATPTHMALEPPSPTRAGTTTPTHTTSAAVPAFATPTHTAPEPPSPTRAGTTTPTAQIGTPTTPACTVTGNLSGVADLFVTPEQGILAQPPSASGKKGRRLKKPTVTVPTLRRSKRQAANRLNSMPAEQRANYVLCRRLGYIKDELTPVEQAIREFVASFQGAMPQDIVAALTAVFRLDDNYLSSATDALIKLGGPEAADGLPELADAA
ncbi:unnamed protein product [Urochloa decumbens]|uniref:Uncharacterized protein n=1 Tax=Urochloa decumbens TaxID=240449 RepID=A0ABC9A429_9POAL